MLELGGQPPVVPKPTPDIQSTDAPSHITEFLAGGLVLLACLVTLVVFFMQRSEQKTLAAAEIQYLRLQSELKADPLAATATTASHLEQAKSALETVGNDSTWSTMLKEVQKTIPAGIVLVHFSVDERGVAKLEGKASSYEQTASYLATLRASTYVQRADLISTSRVDDQKGSYTAFTFNVQVNKQLLGRAS